MFKFLFPRAFAIYTTIYLTVAIMLSLSQLTIALVLVIASRVNDLGCVSTAVADTPSLTLPPTVSLQSYGCSGSGTAATFVGRHLPAFNQDVFLGIKYADEPVRFTPSEVKTSYDDLAVDGDGLIDATRYGFDCPGYGDDEDKLQELGWTRLAEDCLHLNVVRPRAEGRRGEEAAEGLLPVLVWIYGGGYQQGATSDPR